MFLSTILDLSTVAATVSSAALSLALLPLLLALAALPLTSSVIGSWFTRLLHGPLGASSPRSPRLQFPAVPVFPTLAFTLSFGTLSPAPLGHFLTLATLPFAGIRRLWLVLFL